VEDLDQAALGKIIRLVRESAGYSDQREAAALAKVRAEHLSRYERGKVEPKALTLFRMLGAWGISLAEFESLALGLEGKLGPYAELKSEVAELSREYHQDRIERQTGVRLPDAPKDRRPTSSPRRDRE
jgi:transcriptional regulator with XRE-family HTH domain